MTDVTDDRGAQPAASVVDHILHAGAGAFPGRGDGLPVLDGTREGSGGVRDRGGDICCDIEQLAAQRLTRGDLPLEDMADDDGGPLLWLLGGGLHGGCFGLGRGLRHAASQLVRADRTISAT